LSYVSASDPDVQALRSVRAQVWTRPSRTWATALPMVLDRFPKRNGRQVEEIVAHGCEVAGLPAPVAVEVARQGSLLPGAPDLPGRALRRAEKERPLPARHVRVHFDRPVKGPVVLGSKKNFGLGLCLPCDDTTKGEAW
jgi:CRISPR-associated protein Csb2